MAIAPDGGPNTTVLGAGNATKGSYGAVLPSNITPTIQNILQGMQQQNTLLANSYSPGSPGYTVGGGSSLVQTGPSLAQIQQMLGIGNIQTPSLADLTKQAQAQTDLTINPKEQALQTLINQLNSTAANSTNQLQAFGAAQKSDVQSTFDRLKAFTDAATQAGLQRYGQTSDAVNTGNQQTLDALARNQANATQAVNTEQSRLGLNGAGSTIDNSRLSSDAAFLQGLADVNKNNAANNLASQTANYQGVQNLLSQGQQQAGAQAQNQIAQQLLSKLAAIQNTQEQGVSGNQAQIAALEGSKAAQTQANLAGLQDAQNKAIQQQQALMLQAISAANAGTKTVSGGSTRVGATPATGLSPEAALANELKYAQLQDSQNNSAATQSNNAASQALAQQKYILSLLTSGLSASQLSSLLGGTATQPQQQTVKQSGGSMVPGL